MKHYRTSQKNLAVLTLFLSARISKDGKISNTQNIFNERTACIGIIVIALLVTFVHYLFILVIFLRLLLLYSFKHARCILPLHNICCVCHSMSFIFTVIITCSATVQGLSFHFMWFIILTKEKFWNKQELKDFTVNYELPKP